MTDEPTTTDPEEVAVTATPAVPSGGAAPTGTASGRPSPLGRVTALLAVLGAIAAVLAVLQALDAADLREDRRDRREVQAVAGAFGQAYLTYDFEDVEASSEAVRELATDAFAAGFEETSAPGIQELFASNQTTTAATVRNVFVGSVDDGEAQALVIVDVVATSAASGTQRLTGLSFVLDLVEAGGDWRVSAVTPAPRPDISDPGGSTSTTQPPSPGAVTTAPPTPTSAP